MEVDPGPDPEPRPGRLVLPAGLHHQIVSPLLGQSHATSSLRRRNEPETENWPRQRERAGLWHQHCPVHPATRAQDHAGEEASIQVTWPASTNQISPFQVSGTSPSSEEPRVHPVSFIAPQTYSIQLCNRYFKNNLHSCHHGGHLLSKILYHGYYINEFKFRIRAMLCLDSQLWRGINRKVPRSPAQYQMLINTCSKEIRRMSGY